jgi:Ran GTPase-activating protein (RanGAP) involved in mRNA processing and transport
MEQFDQLEVLEFRGNTMGVAASGPIAEAIACRPELKVSL